jgi:surfeit locus 1 family protein
VSPKLRFVLLTTGAVLGLAATLSLGRWQLSRAAQKEALFAAIESQNRLPPVTQAQLLASTQLEPLLHRNVQLRGQWVAQRTVFLDNRQMHDQAGFYVVTPLQLQDSQAVILVQRGWVPRNFLDRTALPRIDTPAGVVEVQGRMAPPPSKLYAFQAVESGAIRQNLDLAAFSTETGLPLVAASIFQTGPPAAPLQRDWPKANTGVEKHYGYAFQWFGLAALIAILYVWFQIVRRFIPQHPCRREPV